MTAQIIDGKAIAQAVRAEWKVRADALIARGITPGMAVIIVGNDPASRVYVANKVKACAELGLYSIHVELPADTTEAALLAEVEALNNDPRIHGIPGATAVAQASGRAQGDRGDQSRQGRGWLP